MRLRAGIGLLFVISIVIARRVHDDDDDDGDDDDSRLLPNNGIKTLPNSLSEGKNLCKAIENNGRQITDTVFANRFLRCREKKRYVYRCKHPNSFFFEFLEQCVELPQGKPFADKIDDSVNDGRRYARPCRRCPYSYENDICDGSGDGSGDGGGDGDDNGSGKPPGHHPNKTTTTTTTTENPNYKCPEGVDFPVNIPHPCGCRKYQVCDHGVKHVAYCKEGQVYDIPRRICNRARDVKCPNEGHDCDDDPNSMKVNPATYGADLDDGRCNGSLNYNYQFQKGSEETQYYDMYGSCRGKTSLVLFCPDKHFFHEDLEFCIPFPTGRINTDATIPADSGSLYANQCRYCNPLARRRHRRFVGLPPYGPPIVAEDADDTYGTTARPGRGNIAATTTRKPAIEEFLGLLNPSRWEPVRVLFGR